MTSEQAIQYIHAHSWKGKKAGLDRVRALLSSMGDPQKSVRCIHVAGTNGKGSVCAMLDSILRAAGYRVGMFTSPYIRVFHERMRADVTRQSKQDKHSLLLLQMYTIGLIPPIYQVHY